MKKIKRLVSIILFGVNLTIVRLTSNDSDAHKASETTDAVVAEGNFSSLQTDSYTVKAGDSVTTIARDFIKKYALREPDYELVMRIQRDNNLDEYHLDIGQVITVRYWD